jgi:hypothetical protein
MRGGMYRPLVPSIVRRMPMGESECRMSGRIPRQSRALVARRREEAMISGGVGHSEENSLWRVAAVALGVASVA